MPTSENPLGLGHSQKILQVEGDEKRIPNYVRNVEVNLNIGSNLKKTLRLLDSHIWGEEQGVDSTAHILFNTRFRNVMQRFWLQTYQVVILYD